MKVLILFCGGTIIMQESKEGSLVVAEKQKAIKSLLSLEPRLKEVSKLDVEYVDNIDSSNITGAHWDKIATIIAKKYDRYDGFVITHGTDTMSYTASALSFALQNLGKPVVLTGAQVPPEMLGSDALTNLVHACQVATMDLAEVMIVFGTRILRGNRSMKVSESERNAFLSPVFPPLGTIRLQPDISYPNVKRRHGGAITLRDAFAGNIAVGKCVPGMD